MKFFEHKNPTPPEDAPFPWKDLGLYEDPDESDGPDPFSTGSDRGDWSLTRLVLPLLLLAALCIGAVELAVCAVADPELFQLVTDTVYAHVVTGVHHLEQVGHSVLDGVSQAVQRLIPEEEEEPLPVLEEEVSQVVDDTELSPPPRAMASYETTTLIQRDGQDLLTGGSMEIVYFNQTDPAWAEQPYGSDQLGGYGCGPTAMAMAVASMTDTDTDPLQMGQWCVDHHYWASRQGSYLSIVQGAAEGFGVTCTPIPPEEVSREEIIQYLATGNLIAALMGPGHFTNRGHFILLRGITLEGGVLVADPASLERSLTVWDLELILDELSAKRHDGAPLWLLSVNLL